MKMDMINYLMGDTAWSQRLARLSVTTIILEEIVIFNAKRERNFLSNRQDVCKAFVGKFMKFDGVLLRDDQSMTAAEWLDVQKGVTDP